MAASALAVVPVLAREPAGVVEAAAARREPAAARAAVAVVVVSFDRTQ
jgi:hypothetical protein